MRIGVNTGEVVVRSIETGDGQTEYTPIGHATNLASRMQTLAPTGSIAISEQTRKLVEGYFALKPLGPTRIKGVSEPVNVYEVTGLGPLRTRLQRSAGRGLTKFVGREREMDAMQHARRAGQGRSRADRRSDGGPGVGKSRLFYEFKAGPVGLDGAGDVFGLARQGVGVSAGDRTAARLFRDHREDDARKRREKIAGKVLMLDRTLEDTLPYLFGCWASSRGDDPLAQMDPQIRKRRTLEAIKRILLREASTSR